MSASIASVPRPELIGIWDKVTMLDRFEAEGHRRYAPMAASSIDPKPGRRFSDKADAMTWTDSIGPRP